MLSRTATRSILIGVALFTSVATVASAQDLGADFHPESNPEHDSCYQYWRTVFPLIPEYHRQGMFDSIEVMTTRLDSLCEPVRNYYSVNDYKLVRLIETGQIDSNWCDSTIDSFLFGLLASYMEDVDFGERGPIVRPDLQTYNDFVDSLAQALSERIDTTSLEHLVCQYCLDRRDYIIDRLKNGGYPNTCYQRTYDRKVAAIEYDLEHRRIHAAFNVGLWAPLGNADVLGNKVEVGGEFGLRKSRFGFDGTVLVRFLDAKDDYELYLNSALTPTTEQFLGAYIGASVSHRLFSQMKYGIELFAGGGYDGFRTKHDDGSATLHSYNINTGLTARYFYNDTKNRFWGLQLRFSFVDYDTNGGTDLSGNTISLNVIYGYMGNPNVTDRARRLHYYGR